MSYGPPLESIELFVDQVAAKIDAILAATGASRVAIVGHSMGGIVGRAYLRRHGARQGLDGDDARLAAPRQRPRLALSGDLARAAAPGERVARRAQSRPKSLPPGVRVVSLWSWHDSMVAPQTSARLDGAENIALPGIGHNALVGNRRVFALVAAELTRAAAGVGSARTASRGLRAVGIVRRLLVGR